MRKVHFRRYGAALAVAMLVAGMCGGIPASASGSSVTYVAPGGTNEPGCNSVQPCATIAYALSQTSAGGTVYLAAGAYEGQLTISQDVTIDGAGLSSIIEPSSSTPLLASETDTDSDNPQAVIVYVDPGVGNANFENLEISGASGTNEIPNPGSTDYVGLYYRDASGSVTNVTITGVQQPTGSFGDQPGTNGSVYVATDSLTASNPPTCCNGTPGAWVAPPPSYSPSNVHLTNVIIGAYDKNGITCDDLGTVCTITDSVVTGIGPTPLNAQNGIQVWGASASITDDVVQGNQYVNPPDTSSGNWTGATGVLVFNALNLTISNDQVFDNNDDVYVLEDSGYPPDPTPGPWVISNNDVSNATLNGAPVGQGLGDGIDVDSATSGVSVIDNIVNNDLENGISLYGAAGVSVNSNFAQSDGTGVYVGGPGTLNTISTGNSVDSNTAINNATYGIDLDADSSGNSMVGNLATGNGTDDVADVTTGSGTLSTANTWNATTCATSSPLGLCTPTPLVTHAQSPFEISNSPLTGTALKKLKLQVSGGSGKGAVTFSALGAGCVISGKRLRATSPGTCVVIGTKAAFGAYFAATSPEVTFTIGTAAQKSLRISFAPKSPTTGQTVTLSTKGGSGTGAVSFSTASAHCSIAGALLTASVPTTCDVTATKAASGVYGAATSVTVAITYT